MNRMVSLIMCVVLGFGFIAAPTCPAMDGEAIGPNLAPNPGFEELTEDGKPVGWSGPWDIYGISEENPRSGKHSLRYDNSDLERYVFCKAPLDLKPGRFYEYEVWVRSENLIGVDYGATFCIEWLDGTCKYLGQTWTSGVKGTVNEWTTRIYDMTPRIPKNAKQFNAVCYLRNGNTGVAFWDDVVVREYAPPLLQAIVCDRYRNESYGEAVTVKAGLSLEVHNVAPGDVEVKLRVLDANGREVAVAAADSVSASEVTFTLDTSAWAVGEYTLRCEMSGEALDRTVMKEMNLKRLAQQPERKAYFDAHRRLILDGKPFFPLGTYWGGLSAEHLKIYAESPFNCVMPYGSLGLGMENLDRAHALGIQVIYSVKDFYAPYQGLKTAEDERRAVEKQVNKFKDHPAIMAWYVNDEMPLTMIDSLTKHQRWMEELDSQHPTWAVLYQVSHVRSFLPTFDAIGTDPYPIKEFPIRMVVDYTQGTVDETFGMRPVWMVPQIMNRVVYQDVLADRLKHRAPTLEEMRNMAWQCIVGGANGLIFYSWFDLWRADKTLEEGGRALVRDPFEERWKDVCQMAGEIESMFPVLLSTDAPPKVQAVDAPEAIAWRTFTKGSDAYLAAVNVEREPAEASFTFALEPKAIAMQLGDEPTGVAGNSIKLTFAPLEVKVIKMTMATTKDHDGN